jgi:hypothetical protein
LAADHVIEASMSFPPCLPAIAEFVARQGDAAAVRHEDIVAAVRTAARAKVPDHLKAELLKRLRSVLEG